MNHVFRTIVNASVLRNFPRRPVFRALSEINKDLVKAEALQSQDFLLQNLKNAPSTNKVLELISAHHRIMNKNHLLQALRSLFLLQKHGSTGLSTQQILKRPEFEKICYHLKSQSGLIELNETIEALKVISFMGASSTSTIVQILLQIIRHNINHLSLQQIIFLDFLLGQFKKSPLVDALQLAMPIVFEIQLPIKMDRNNLPHLIECFHYATKKNLSAESIEKIVDSIQNSPYELDGKMALSIVWSITDVRADEFFEPLLTTAMNTIILNLDSLTYSELETTISRLIHKYSPKLKFYYNETLFDMTANYLMEKDLGFDTGTYLLWKFNKIDHINTHLLDYLSQKAEENPNLIMNSQPSKICNLINSLALTDYKPICHANLLKSIQQYSTFTIPDSKDILWFKLAASLCILKIYKRDILIRALENGFLSRALKRRFKPDFDYILCVIQLIKTYKPDLKDLLPPVERIEDIAFKCFHSTPSSLEVPLQKVLGGAMYVKSKLISTSGHQIDHAVMYRKGGYPVALNTTSNQASHYVEDIDIPPESQLILILELTPEHYCINRKKMKCTTSVAIRTLEANGFTVLPVCLEDWTALADFEKLPYLMQNIKFKLRDDIGEAVNIV